MCGGIKRKFLLCFGALMAQISLFSTQEVSEFDLSQLRISKDSPFYRAMLVDKHYLLSYDYDRLVAYIAVGKPACLLRPLYFQRQSVKIQ